MTENNNESAEFFFARDMWLLAFSEKPMFDAAKKEWQGSGRVHFTGVASDLQFAQSRRARIVLGGSKGLPIWVTRDEASTTVTLWPRKPKWSARRGFYFISKSEDDYFKFAPFGRLPWCEIKALSPNSAQRARLVLGETMR